MKSIGRLSILVFICLIRSFVTLNGQVCGDGVTDALMEYETGAAKLSKIGLRVCTDSCVPKYYTVQENNYNRRKITVTPGYLSLPCNYNLPTATMVESEIYTATVIMDKYLDSFGVQREGCFVGYPLQTSLNNGGGQMTSTGDSSCTSTAAPGGAWSDPACYTLVYNALHPMDLSDSTGTVTVDTCTKVVTRYILPTTTPATDCVVFTTNREYEEGTSWSNEFTTGELKSVLDSRAAARVPSVFAVGAAIAYRKLNNTEDCGEAADTKFRIRIEDYIPTTWYRIKWHVLKLHRNGVWEHYTPSAKMRAPTSGDFFYPSAAGKLLPKPMWPPGACNQGGGEYAIYFNPTVTVIEE